MGSRMIGTRLSLTGLQVQGRRRVFSELHLRQRPPTAPETCRESRAIDARQFPENIVISANQLRDENRVGNTDN